MKYSKWELTKEDYEKYKDNEPLFSKEQVPIEIHCGYGYYGTQFKEEKGKYFAYVSMGNSCD